MQRIGPGCRVSQMQCVTERAAFSQNDVDPSRPPGSSCCTLFCSRLALKVLDSRSGVQQISASLSMPSLRPFLLKAVRDWDKTGLVDGAPEHTVLARCEIDRSGFRSASCHMVGCRISGQLCSKATILYEFAWKSKPCCLLGGSL